LVNFTYGVFDGKDFILETYKNDAPETFITDLSVVKKINIF